METQEKILGEQLDNLPYSLRLTYGLWRSGRDVRSLMSRSTYYNHYRRLKAYGINIKQAYNPLSQTNH